VAELQRRIDVVLEGGGVVKGIAFAGALSVLEEHGYAFQRLAGTSAGAMVAALVAAGYSAAQLVDVMRSVDYRHLRDRRRRSGRVTLSWRGDRGLFGNGMYRGDYLVEWLGALLDEKGITTFEQLRLDDPGSSLPPSLRYSLLIHAADITRFALVRLPWDYDAYGLVAGEQRVVDAVRAAMAIPFLFEPVKVSTRAVGFEDFRDIGDETIWVDGSLLSNFSVEVFDRTDGQPARWPTIGLKLVGRESPLSSSAAHDELLAHLANLPETVHVGHLRAARSIFIDTTDIEGTDFDLAAEAQSQLFDNGRQAAEEFLRRSDREE
jgi:NTE family protein